MAKRKAKEATTVKPDYGVVLKTIYGRVRTSLINDKDYQEALTIGISQMIANSKLKYEDIAA